MKMAASTHSQHRHSRRGFVIAEFTEHPHASQQRHFALLLLSCVLYTPAVPPALHFPASSL